MEIFDFLLLLLSATHTCSRRVGPSQSHHSLYARVEAVPEEDPGRPPPRINPWASPDYEGNDYPMPKYMQNVENVADKKPPWDTRPVVNDESLYKLEDDPPADQGTGLVMGRSGDGKQVWQLWLGEDLLGPKPAATVIETVGYGFARFFRGADARQPDRVEAAKRIRYVAGREEGNLVGFLGDMKNEIEDLFGSYSSSEASALSARRFIWSSAMEDLYTKLDQQNPGVPVQVLDNRYPGGQAPASGSGSKLPSNFGNYRGYGPDTFGDQKRKRDVISTITGAVLPSNSNSTMNQESAYEAYFEAFIVAQSNASIILIPIIEEMMSRSNSSLVWNAAWSLFADLTGSSPSVIGPFSFGFNSIGSLEDHIFASLGNSSHLLNQTMATKRTNGTALDLAKDLIMATTGEAIEIYNEGWANATAALNKTGLMPVMASLASNMSPLNESEIPSQFLSNTTSSYDNSFFLDYTRRT